MKLLLCTAFLPPYAPVSAVRVSKLAGHLLATGHDVRLLGARNPLYPPLISPDFPTERALYVPYLDVREVPERLAGRRRAAMRDNASPPGPVPTPPAQSTATVKRGRLDLVKAAVRSLNSAVLAVPDNFRFWARPAAQAAIQAWPDWRPDLIYATAPPHSSLRAAASLAKHWQVPWIAEYRDLWTEHPYYDAPAWRQPLERRLEQRVTASAAGFVTVTQTWADWLGRRGKPVLLAMNGFDPQDYEAAAARPKPDDPARPLSLLYAGALYENKRDPTALFQAVAQLPDKQRLSIEFYTPDPGKVEAIAKRTGVSDQVNSHGPVPRKDILRLEQDSDVLVLLRWDDPREDSVIAGKLFEYIGARRPILSVGRTQGEAAAILRDNALGVVSNDPSTIADFLARALSEGADKAANYDASRSEGFARGVQFDRIEAFMRDVTGRSADLG